MSQFIRPRPCLNSIVNFAGLVCGSHEGFLSEKSLNPTPGLFFTGREVRTENTEEVYVLPSGLLRYISILYLFFRSILASGVSPSLCLSLRSGQSSDLGSPHTTPLPVPLARSSRQPLRSRLAWWGVDLRDSTLAGMLQSERTRRRGRGPPAKVGDG